MIIKNISTRVVRLEDFPDERPLLPGATADLSKYPFGERAQSDQLQDFFQKGALVCLGHAPTSKKFSGTKLQATQLTKYQYKSDHDANDVLIPSKTMAPVVNSSHKKEIPTAVTTPERYNKEALDQYKYELQYEQDSDIPPFEEKEYEEERIHSFVQVQDEDQVLTLSIDEETGTTFVDELLPGQIPTDFATDPSVFTDKHKYTVEDMIDFEKQKEILQERLQKRIESRVRKKCLYPRSDGKPCQRDVLAGYDRCYRHLSKEQKEKYNKDRS